MSPTGDLHGDYAAGAKILKLYWWKHPQYANLGDEITRLLYQKLFDIDMVHAPFILRILREPVAFWAGLGQKRCSSGRHRYQSSGPAS